MNKCKLPGPWRLLAAPLVALASLAVVAAPSTAVAQTLVKVKAGMVTGIDQVGLPIALERGFFEKHGLDVTVARPYATGVDALNALQAGESEIVQVGVPMIGAVLRGMDLVALGKLEQCGHPSHLPVAIGDLTDHRDRLKAGEFDQIDCGFGVPGALEHTTVAGSKRKHMPGPRKIVRPRM